MTGIIVPDLPVDEAEAFDGACAARGIDAVLLAAPGAEPPTGSRRSPPRARGFVYCVATYGVTGARETLGTTAEELVGSIRPLTDLPLLVGVGIGTPEQAAEASAFADGVIVGSALMASWSTDDREGMLELARAFRGSLPRA